MRHAQIVLTVVAGLLAIATILLGCVQGDAKPTPSGAATKPPATATSAPAMTATPASPTAPPTQTPPAAPVASPEPPSSPALEPTEGAQPPPTIALQPTEPPPRPAGGGSASLTIAGIDSKFSPSSVTAPAGAVVTLTFNNQDDGVTHDIVVFDPFGAMLVATELAEGPIVQMATFTLGGPGAYSFKCSVHPQQMRGFITVQ